MSALLDSLRTLPAELFAEMADPATITTKTAGTRDRINDTFTAGTTTTKNIRAVVGKRRTVADDGAVTVQSIAKMTGSAKAGDILTIGTSTFQIADVEDLAPDGGVPLVWTAVLS